VSWFITVKSFNEKYCKAQVNHGNSYSFNTMPLLRVVWIICCLNNTCSLKKLLNSLVQKDVSLIVQAEQFSSERCVTDCASGNKQYLHPMTNHSTM